MNYFRIVKLWKILTLNIIVGVLVSSPIFIGLIMINGILFSAPSIEEKLQGYAIITVSILVVILANYILWKAEKKRLNNNLESINSNGDNHRNSRNRISVWLKVVIVIIVAVIGMMSFMFEDFWLFLNGWWF